MEADQAIAYRDWPAASRRLSKALRKRDTTLLGVVLNVLLARPDTCFRPETVTHPRTRELLAFTPSQFNELEITPKERELIDICKAESRGPQGPGLYRLHRDAGHHVEAEGSAGAGRPEGRGAARKRGYLDAKTGSPSSSTVALMCC